MELQEHRLKISVVGAAGAGKSSLVKRYVNDFFSKCYKATVGVDFALKILTIDDNNKAYFQLWDIAGQDRFGTMTAIYYKKSVAVIIVFDVNDPKSLYAVDKWIADVRDKIQYTVPLILLGNKIDLRYKRDTEFISQARIENVVKRNNFAAYFEVSAKENINVSVAFNTAVLISLEIKMVVEEEDNRFLNSKEEPENNKKQLFISNVCMCRIKDQVEEHKNVNIFISLLGEPSTNEYQIVKWTLSVIKDSKLVGLFPLGSKGTLKLGVHVVILQDKIGNHFVIQSNKNLENIPWIGLGSDFRIEPLSHQDLDLALWYLYVGYCMTVNRIMLPGFKDQIMWHVEKETEICECSIDFQPEFELVDYKQILHTLVWSNISSVRLSSNLQVVAIIEFLGEFRKLTKLYLFNCGIDSKMLDTLLNNLGEKTMLKILDLAGNFLNASDITLLLDFIFRNKSINELDISFNKNVGGSLFEKLQFFISKNSPLNILKALGYPMIKYPLLLLNSLLCNSHLMEFHTDLSKPLQYNIDLILQRNQQCANLVSEQILKIPIPSFHPIILQQEDNLSSPNPIKFSVLIIHKYFKPSPGQLIIQLGKDINLLNVSTKESFIFSHKKSINIGYLPRPSPTICLSDEILLVNLETQESISFNLLLTLSHWNKINNDQIVSNTKSSFASTTCTVIRKTNRFGNGLDKLNTLKVRF